MAEQARIAMLFDAGLIKARYLMSSCLVWLIPEVLESLDESDGSLPTCDRVR